MKQLILFALIVFTIGCNDKYDDTEIKQRLDNLEGVRIPSAESQISAIQASLPLLRQTDEEIKGYITTLQDKVSTLDQSIKQDIDGLNRMLTALQSANRDFEKKISDLDGKIDTQKDWVTTTFTTLTQYNGLVSDIAVIQTNIETINKNITDLETDYPYAIASAIDNCIVTMKDWINEKLANYYNIAAIDAKVLLLQNSIANGDKKLDEKLRNEIVNVNKSIETAESELTAAYENAIKTAIETNNGIIDNKISQEIAIVNNRIDTEVRTLITRIDDIETRLFSLENSVSALLKRIQSVSFIPRYADGKVEMKRVVGEDNGFAELDFMISPKDAVVELEQLWKEAVSVKAVYTQTRAIDFVDLPILEFSADATNGVVTVKVDGKNLDNDFYFNGKNASVALFISDGNNSVVSNYIPMMANTDTHLAAIHYTTTDNKPVSAPILNNGNIVEHKYENAKGSIIFSLKVTDIQPEAFKNCGNLESITIPEGVTTIEYRAFYECNNLTNINIPEGVTKIGYYAFSHCSSLTSINIPESITTIESDAFWNCRSLTSITIPKSITTIESGTFYSCHSLTSINILGSITTIGSSAFAYCISLTSVTIPESVKNIGNFAFSHCSSLTSINIPEGVASIGSNTFSNCSNLTNITIPEGVTSIGESAFYDCSNLSKYYFRPITPPNLASNALNLLSTHILYVPRSSVDTYKTADVWKDYASQIVGYDF